MPKIRRLDPLSIYPPSAYGTKERPVVRLRELNSYGLFAVLYNGITIGAIASTPSSPRQHNLGNYRRKLGWFITGEIANGIERAFTERRSAIAEVIRTAKRDPDLQRRLRQQEELLHRQHTEHTQKELLQMASKKEKDVIAEALADSPVATMEKPDGAVADETPDSLAASADESEVVEAGEGTEEVTQVASTNGTTAPANGTLGSQKKGKASVKDALKAQLDDLEAQVGTPPPGSIPAKPPKPAKGTGKGGGGGTGTRSKKVWLILENIPSQPAYKEHESLTAAYDDAMSIVKDLRENHGITLKRGGERGIDRFWSLDAQAADAEAKTPATPARHIHYSLVNPDPNAPTEPEEPATEPAPVAQQPEASAPSETEASEPELQDSATETEGVGDGPAESEEGEAEETESTEDAELQDDVEGSDDEESDEESDEEGEGTEEESE